MLSRRGLAVLATTAALTLTAGCSSTPETPAVTPEAALSSAAAELVAAGFVKLSLTSADMPSDRNGVAEAIGTGEFSTTEPKFAGTIQGRVGGVTANLEIIAIGDRAWWKLFTPEYTEADLAGVGAPNPAGFFHPTSGLPSLVTAATDLTVGKDTRLGKDILTTYTGNLPGSVIKDLLYLGDGTGTFEATYGVTTDGQLRQAVVTGPFYEGTTSTYTLQMTDHGRAATITAPR